MAIFYTEQAGNNLAVFADLARYFNPGNIQIGVQVFSPGGTIIAPGQGTANISIEYAASQGRFEALDPLDLASHGTITTQVSAINRVRFTFSGLVTNGKARGVVVVENIGA